MVQTRKQRAEAIAATTTRSEPKRKVTKKEEKASPNRKLTKKERLEQAREKGQEFGKRDKARIEQHKAKRERVVQTPDDVIDVDDDDSRNNTTQPKKKKRKKTIETNRKMAPLEERKENGKVANSPKTQAQAQSMARKLPPQSILNWTTKVAIASKTPTQKAEVIEIDNDSDSDDDKDSDEDRKPAAKPTISSAIPRSDGSNNGRKRQRFIEEQQTQSTIESDMALAQKLQKEEKERLKQEIQKEQKAMADNKSGKAVLAVQSIIKLVQDLKEKFPMYADDINEVSVDDMVYLAERLLGQQQDFVSNNIPAYVDLGYHYTSIENTEKIRENGLLTKSERAQACVQVLKNHGSVFGDGVYTANNPIAWSGYGAVGLIVARLQGANVRVPFALKVHNFQVDGNINTIVGDKITDAMKENKDFDDDGWPTNDYNHEVVLRSSTQVLPLVKYNKPLIKTSKGRKCIQQFESSLQNILDGLFNKGHQRAPMGVVVGDKSRYFPTSIVENLSQSRAAALRESYIARIINSSGSNFFASFHYIPFADAVSAGFYLQQTRSALNTTATTATAATSATSATSNASNVGRSNSTVQQLLQQQQYQQYQQLLLRAHQAININNSATTSAMLFNSLPILYRAPDTTVAAAANDANTNAATATATATATAVSAPSYVSNAGRSNITVQRTQLLLQKRQAININNSATTSATLFNPLPILYRAPKTTAAVTSAAAAAAAAAATSALSSNVTVQRTQLLLQARQAINNSATRSANASPILYRAPNTIAAGVPSNALAETSLFKVDDECPICQDALCPGPCVMLTVCNHVFHRSCVERAFEVKSQCPICNKEIGKPQGKSPSGSMSVSYTNLGCSGFVFESTIVVTYSMKSGTQKSYHENPGQPHRGKRTTAYVPHNTDGKNLLKRLKYAFLHGLTFTVGASLTTGIANQCTWSNIHHKTSLNGGVTSHGYPDSGYLANCNEELDSVNVPPADSLCDDGTEM
jgi:deltex-like protein